MFNLEDFCCCDPPRTSIASYRAEATFFKTVAASKALGDIVPHAFWVHVDDRLGGEGARGGDGDASAASAPRVGGAGDGAPQDEEEAIKALRESCFMMITGGCGLGERERERAYACR